MDSRTTSASSSVDLAPRHCIRRPYYRLCSPTLESSDSTSIRVEYESQVSISLNILAAESSACEAQTTIASGSRVPVNVSVEGASGTVKETVLEEWIVPHFDHRFRSTAEEYRSKATEVMRVSYLNTYFIPEEYDLRLSSENWTASLPLVGYAAVYDLHFYYGLRFPLLPLVVEVLQHYKLALSQLVPNVVLAIVGFVVLCYRAGIEATLGRFRYFYRLQNAHQSTVGWYTFYPWIPGLKLVKDAKSSNKKWKSDYYLFKTEPLGFSLN